MITKIRQGLQSTNREGNVSIGYAIGILLFTGSFFFIAITVATAPKGYFTW